jgi:DNA-binding transcriptional regulator YhcF (GntR family)
MRYISHKPIYLQIAYDIVLKIKEGDIPKASLLPSVRELSVIYEVTPKTIQAVTKYLSDNGIIKVKPGVGSVITNDDKIINNIHQSHARLITSEYISQMKQIKSTDEEIMKMIQLSLKEETCHDKNQ